MKHSKHDWFLRHQINEALHNPHSSKLAFERMQEALRSGLDGADPVTRLIHTSVRDAFKDVTVISSGCDCSVQLFVLVKRE